MFIPQRIPVPAHLIRGSTDMKLISKTRRILGDNSGETIVEVMVAFTLLTIMLLIFSQGIAFATNSERRAGKIRKSADDAMVDLQKERSGTDLDNVTPGGGDPKPVRNTAEGQENLIRRYNYSVIEDSEGHSYIVYEVAS